VGGGAVPELVQVQAGPRRHATCPLKSYTGFPAEVVEVMGPLMRRTPAWWEREGLSKRDRSLITVAALTTMGKNDQLTFHLDYARQNGVTETELKEAITHLADGGGIVPRRPVMIWVLFSSRIRFTR
jgi:alkylhydroperoxidase/carboxymuconolactone decarboxylase family protein YurZ